MPNVTAKKPPPWWRLADPYLRWAHFTNFRYFRHGKGASFGILAELGTELDEKRHRKLAKAGIIVGGSYIGRRFVTAELQVSRRRPQLAAFLAIGAARLELATPVAAPRAVRSRPFKSEAIKPTHLIGVIDDGCPFAHAGLLAGGKSRVTFLWDQGATAPRCQSATSPYGYGYYFNEASIEYAIKRGTPAGAAGADEDAVYDAAGQDRLRPLATHGAHVLGLAAASVPARNRISPSRFDERQLDATAPPTWQPDPAPESDPVFAFVQIPKDCLDDSSGRWLDRNVLDGIHAILDYAEHAQIARATINVSFGPQTGAHDGSSLLERAIDELVGMPKDVEELFVVVPVGNSCQSRAHAEIELKQGGGEIAWHVPPDSETPAFLEIWLPRGTHYADVQIKVTAADLGSRTPIADRIAGAARDSWHLVTSNAATPGNPQWVTLIALGATGGYERQAQPPHGRWLVSVTAKAGTKGCAHVYVARNDYNFGGLRRGRPSHLWQASYDPDRFMRSREYDPPEDVNAPRPVVHIYSRGTVSGLASGELSNVAAGYRLSDCKPAIYSSAGPSRGKRTAPDWAYPTDESRVFAGLISWGTRSGASVRLAGTSAASPQYARAIDREGKKATQPPQGYPPNKADPRIGWGRKN